MLLLYGKDLHKNSSPFLFKGKKNYRGLEQHVSK